MSYNISKRQFIQEIYSFFRDKRFYSVMLVSKMCGSYFHVNSPCLRKPAKVHATFKSYRTCSTYATSIYDYQFLHDPQITVSVATGNILGATPDRANSSHPQQRPGRPILLVRWGNGLYTHLPRSASIPATTLSLYRWLLLRRSPGTLATTRGKTGQGCSTLGRGKTA